MPRLVLSEDQVYQIIAAVTAYIVDVLAGVFRLMKSPLSMFLYSLVLLFVAGVAYQPLQAPAVTLICQIPGMGMFPYCRGPNSILGQESNKTMRVDYPSLMAVQNDAMDKLLMQSSAGSQLAFDIKRAEVVVQGLTSYVVYSKLDNKALIASLLTQFAADAKATGRDIQKLTSKLYGTVARD